MGNSKSKVKVQRNGHAKGSDYVTNQSTEYDDMELMLLRRTIQRDPESFILNNLMMCVQFFANYEAEIEHLKGTMISSREAKLNKLMPPQKHVLLPDVLQEQVAKNIGFTSTRQTFRPTVEPLHPVRIYTVHDNIDITEIDYMSHYSSVADTATYNILLKPTNHPGYVQLQLLNDSGIPKEKINEEDLSSITENDDEFCSDDSIYGVKISPSQSNYSLLHGQSKLKNSNHELARSLPNLHEDQISSDDPRDLTHSSRNIRSETDNENDYSPEERRARTKRIISKGELHRRINRRTENRTARTKESMGHDIAISSNSSGYRSDNSGNLDSDSSCSHIQISRLSQSFSHEDLEEWIESAKLPDNCFKRVTFTADGNVYDPRRERKLMLNSKQRRIKKALYRHNYDLFYTSCTAFMKYFIHVFVNRLADLFNFDKESVEDIRRKGCVLYCDQITISSSYKFSRVDQYEIIPSIWLQWPTCAQEWLDRPRSTWPHPDDLEKIKDFGCYVVPEGFVPNKGYSNIMADLEWQLTFPTVERYLETCMSQSQVQVYFITLMLYKTFMRPIFDTMFGMTTAHIRHKLFWMIEENDRPSKWPDNRMGECLLSVLKSLYHNISQNEPTLKDYFIADRNLFQRVPCEHLLHTQKQLKRIIENPVMYIFHAMENIRHSEDFFPRLDYEMLLKILTADTLAVVNPALTQRVLRPMPHATENKSSKEDKYSKGFWDTVKNQPKKHSVQAVSNKTLINPHKASDSIIEISTRCANLESPRLCALLDFFVRHFIKIAERCNQYQAYRQKTIYLDHADRLSILLSENPRYTDDGRAYRDKIKVLRKKVGRSESRNQPPETKRNVESAIFTASLKDRFIYESSGEDRISSRANNEQRQSNHVVEPVHNLTKAVVHEPYYQQLKTPTDTRNKDASLTKITTKLDPPRSISFRESETHDSKKPNESIRHIKLSEPASNESTYI